MLKFLPFLLWSLVWNMNAQKVIQKSYPGERIDGILIEGSGVFNIKIVAQDTPTILVQSKINGEGFENVLLQLRDESGQLILGYDYTPFFKPANDKLAAHKVLAIEMELVIPLHMTVSIASQLASVQGNGPFKQLNIVLDSGMIDLINFRGDAYLSTRDGDINVEVTGLGIGAQAISKEGRVINELSATEKLLLIVQSVKGDITLLKSQ